MEERWFILVSVAFEDDLTPFHLMFVRDISLSKSDPVINQDQIWKRFSSVYRFNPSLGKGRWGLVFTST